MAKLTVVAPMIVRNEADNLPHLFASAEGLVDSWVVLDTGSTDNTVEVARGLGATVLEDPWDDNFARSRNLVLAAAEGKWDGDPDAWVLILDGDDRVENPLALRKDLEESNGKEVYALKVFSAIENGGVEIVYQTRAWKLSTGVRYRNPCHAAPNVDFLRDEQGNVHLTFLEGGCIRHLGYASEAGRIRNVERTLRICREKMDESDPNRWAFESRALAGLNRWDESLAPSMKLVSYFRQQGALATPSPYIYAARALLLKGDLENSLLLLAECLQMGGGSQPDLWSNIIQTAAFGLMASSLVHMQGAGDMSSTAHTAYDVLHALNSSGLLEEGIQPHIMDKLRVYRDEVTGTRSYSHNLEGYGWNALSKSVPHTGKFGEDLSGLRVLIVADSDIAGQASTLCRALNLHTPHGARVCIYKSDYIEFSASQPRGQTESPILLDRDGEEGLEQLQSLAEEADLVHFIRFPVDCGDLKWSELLNPRKALVQYMGSQLRENADKFREWHEATGVLGIVAWDYTLLEKGWMPYHVPLAYSGAGTLGTVHPINRFGGPLRVCHAPTQREVKQTDLFLKVCQELVDEGHEIEPVLIEGVSNAECLAIKASCHVTYDQLSIGVHGMSAVESMALNHIVVGGISNWALSVHPGVPILRATESTLKDILGSLCTREVYKNELNRLQPVAWAKKMHDPAVVIQRLSYLYDFVVNGHRLLP